MIPGFTPVKMYLDGEYVGTSVTDRNTPWSGTPNLGLSRSYSGYNTYFNGKIDDVAFYNRSLSPEEISSLYNSNQGKKANQVSTDRLVGYLDFDGTPDSAKGSPGRTTTAP